MYKCRGRQEAGNGQRGNLILLNQSFGDFFVTLFLAMTTHQNFPRCEKGRGINSVFEKQISTVCRPAWVQVVGA
jgi:hypothetical protein